jgi:hypothetical protein
VAENELPPPQTIEDLEEAKLCLSPLAWVLSYQYPVHQIGASYRPAMPEVPTFLVVYRDAGDKVGFIELNGATARLLELLRENEQLSVGDVLKTLAAELELSFESIRAFGIAQLRELLDKDVVQAAGSFG